MPCVSELRVVSPYLIHASLCCYSLLHFLHCFTKQHLPGGMGKAMALCQGVSLDQPCPVPFLLSWLLC